MGDIPSIESVGPLEHCAVCGDVIFKWGDGWVHGTDHVAVPERDDEDPEIPLHHRLLTEDDTLIIVPNPEEDA
jgi:hypothetical protein